MKKLMILAGIAAIAATTPAIAKPGHGNHGRGDMARHGQYEHSGHGYYSSRNCPPGLAKKHNGCLPPGIAKKRYERGQRWVSNYGNQWNYNQIPYNWRSQYQLDPRNQYYYGDGYLYSVDPRSMLIEQVIRAIIR